ncbi:MAG: hypothetical protein QFC55_04150 [Chloroflexota bacterium]|nr:hypothetical protein [Chloroflexota bacterium]
MVAALTLASCSLGPAPTLALPLDLTWGPGFSVLVFDSTQLVSGGRQLPFNNADNFGDSATAHPERNEIDITWMGGACTHHPTVTLAGTADALTIQVATPNDGAAFPFLPMSCAAIGLFMGVTLSLRETVAQQAIDVRFSP